MKISIRSYGSTTHEEIKERWAALQELPGDPDLRLPYVWIPGVGTDVESLLTLLDLCSAADDDGQFGSHERFIAAVRLRLDLLAALGFDERSSISAGMNLGNRRRGGRIDPRDLARLGIPDRNDRPDALHSFVTAGSIVDPGLENTLVSLTIAIAAYLHQNPDADLEDRASVMNAAAADSWGEAPEDVPDEIHELIDELSSP